MIAEPYKKYYEGGNGRGHGGGSCLYDYISIPRHMAIRRRYYNNNTTYNKRRFNAYYTGCVSNGDFIEGSGVGHGHDTVEYSSILYTTAPSRYGFGFGFINNSDRHGIRETFIRLSCGPEPCGSGIGNGRGLGHNNVSSMSNELLPFIVIEALIESTHR